MRTTLSSEEKGPCCLAVMTSSRWAPCRSRCFVPLPPSATRLLGVCASVRASGARLFLSGRGCVVPVALVFRAGVWGTKTGSPGKAKLGQSGNIAQYDPMPFSSLHNPHCLVTWMSSDVSSVRLSPSPDLLRPGETRGQSINLCRPAASPARPAPHTHTGRHTRV